MNFKKLVELTSNIPCFTNRFLNAGENPEQINLQLSRWARDGRIVRVHKGLYTLSEPYRKIKPEPFIIANNLHKASYISLQSALGWYGIIPEYVPVTLSVTRGRPQKLNTPLGKFEFRHINKKLFWGYRQINISPGQESFIALPEKALIDLFYLTPGSDSKFYLKELRLQNKEIINKERFETFAAKAGIEKINRIKEILFKIIE